MRIAHNTDHCICQSAGSITPRGCGFVIGYTASNSNEEFFTGEIYDVSINKYLYLRRCAGLIDESKYIIQLQTLNYKVCLSNLGQASHKLTYFNICGTFVLFVNLYILL